METVKIVIMTNRDDSFYPTLGRFLSRREVVAEIGAPIRTSVKHTAVMERP